MALIDLKTEDGEFLAFLEQEISWVVGLIRASDASREEVLSSFIVR